MLPFVNQCLQSDRSLLISPAKKSIQKKTLHKFRVFPHSTEIIWHHAKWFPQNASKLCQKDWIIHISTTLDTFCTVFVRFEKFTHPSRKRSKKGIKRQTSIIRPLYCIFVFFSVFSKVRSSRVPVQHNMLSNMPLKKQMMSCIQKCNLSIQFWRNSEKGFKNYWHFVAIFVTFSVYSGYTFVEILHTKYISNLLCR